MRHRVAVLQRCRATGWWSTIDVVQRRCATRRRPAVDDGLERLCRDSGDGVALLQRCGAAWWRSAEPNDGIDCHCDIMPGTLLHTVVMHRACAEDYLGLRRQVPAEVPQIP